MGNADQGFGPGVQVFAFESGGAVFGHNIIGAETRGGHHRPGRQARHNLGVLAVFGGGRQGDDRNAAVRQRGRLDVVQTAAHPADLDRPDGLAVALAVEVDLDRRVDGYKTGQFGQQQDIVRDARGDHLYAGRSTAEVVQVLGAGQLTGDQLGRVADLIHEIDQPLREHARVQVDPAFFCQTAQHHIGHRANSQLHPGVVRHQFQHGFGDLSIPLGLVRRGVDAERLGRFNGQVNLIDRHPAVARGHRHIGIDLGNDELGAVNKILVQTDRNPQTDRAFAIRR